MSAISQCPGIGNEGRRCAKDEGHEGGCQAVWQADYWLVVARRLGQLIEGGNEWLAYGAAEGERFREQLERARLDLDNAYAYRVRAEAAEKECARLREADVFDGRTAEEWAKFYRYRYDDLVALVSRAEAAEAALTTERATSNDTQTRQGARIRELIEQLAAAKTSAEGADRNRRLSQEKLAACEEALAAARTVADQHLAAHDLLSDQLAAERERTGDLQMFVDMWKHRAETAEERLGASSRVNIGLREQLAAAQTAHTEMVLKWTEANQEIEYLKLAAAQRGHVVEVEPEGGIGPSRALYVSGAYVLNDDSLPPHAKGMLDTWADRLRAALNAPAAKVAIDGWVDADELANALRAANAPAAKAGPLCPKRTSILGEVCAGTRGHEGECFPFCTIGLSERLARLDPDGTAKPRSEISTAVMPGAHGAPAEYRNDDGTGLLRDHITPATGKLIARKAIKVPLHPDDICSHGYTGCTDASHAPKKPKAVEAHLAEPTPARGYLLEAANGVFMGLNAIGRDREHLVPYPTKEAARRDKPQYTNKLPESFGDWRHARIVRADPPKFWVVREGKVRGEGLYFSWSHHAVGGWFVSTRESRWGFPAYAEAKAAAGSTGRIVAVYAKKVKP